MRRGGTKRRPGARSERPPAFLHQAAWPDLFDSLQAAYAELTGTQLELERRVTEIDEARDLFEQVIESMNEALFLLDRTGRVARINRAASSLLERDGAELVGRLLSEVWPMAPIPTTPWQVLQRAPGGAPLTLDVEIHPASGRVVHAHVACGLVRDKWGKITGVLIVARDITDRKRAEEAQRFLAEAGAVLSSSLDPEDILENVAHLAVPRIADWCIVDVLNEDGAIRQVAVAHVDPAKEALARDLRRRYPPILSESHPIAQALHTGRVVIAPDVTDDQLVARARDAEHLGLLRELGIRSHIVAPLIARGRTLAAISLVCGGSGRRYDAQDLMLAEELARRASLAVDNARLYEHERTVAETLQRSLLPQQLPELPGITIAARYLPARPEAVGGDWYDVLMLPGGELGLAMGDVAGRGVRAAAIMGQMRNALRAFAYEGHSPAVVADRLAGLMDPGEMVTLVYLVFDPFTWAIRYVNAGHPPPLVVTPDGTTAFLWGGSLPLGGLLSPSYVDERADLAPGSTILLYTDGLVDMRDTRIDDNLARLEQAAAARRDGLDALLDHVLATMFEGTPGRDDVALLALRAFPLDPDQLLLRFPSRPSALAMMRQTLRRWLKAAGAGAEDTFEITVACAEACTNAIEHAYGPVGGNVEVEARRTAGYVEVFIRDRGQWRSTRAANRGRGYRFMEALMDEVKVMKTPEGTTVHMRRRLGAEREK